MNNYNNGVINTCDMEKLEGTLKPLVHLGLSDFSAIVKTKAFVDKSMFIKEILQQSIIMIAAPRQFGKTTNMDMLKRFLEIQVDEKGKPVECQSSINYRLFADNNLQIFQEKNIFSKHFGSYPVIYADFKHVRVNTIDQFLASFRSVLHKSFLQHWYLTNSEVWTQRWNNIHTFYKYIDDEKHKTLNEQEIIRGLHYLSQILYEHFNKEVFVLIDEYDTPTTEAIFSKGISYSDLDTIAKFSSKLTSCLVKSSPYVTRGLFNASTFLGKLSSYHSKNVIFYPFLWSERFCNFYGFTSEEVAILLKNNNLSGRIDEVRNWYNGYNVKFDDHFIEIHSTWSILNYVHNEEVGNYWAHQGLHNLKPALYHKKIQDQIKKVLDEDVIEIKYKSVITIDYLKGLKQMINSPSRNIKPENINVFIQFLYENGYLNLVNRECNNLELKIPNREIYCEFRKYQIEGSC